MAYDGFDLTGKTAVITGGNGGIGLGFAKAVAAAGADVSIWGTNATKNSSAEAELQVINPSASFGHMRCVQGGRGRGVDGCRRRALRQS